MYWIVSILFNFFYPCKFGIDSYPVWIIHISIQTSAWSHNYITEVDRTNSPLMLAQHRPSHRLSFTHKGNYCVIILSTPSSYINTILITIIRVINYQEWMEKGRLRHRETRVNIHGCLFDGKPMDNTRGQERQTVIFRARNWLLSIWAIEIVKT